jgi:hypothetical protein
VRKTVPSPLTCKGAFFAAVDKRGPFFKGVYSAKSLNSFVKCLEAPESMIQTVSVGDDFGLFPFLHFSHSAPCSKTLFSINGIHNKSSTVTLHAEKDFFSDCVVCKREKEGTCPSLTNPVLRLAAFAISLSRSLSQPSATGSRQ